MFLRIDCGSCTRQHCPSCGDCVVSFITDRPASAHQGGAVVVDAAEFAAIRRLEAAGLIPGLGHLRRSA